MPARLLSTVHLRERRHLPFILRPGEGNAALTCYSDNISQAGCSIWTAATRPGGTCILSAHCAPSFERIGAQKTCRGDRVTMWGTWAGDEERKPYTLVYAIPQRSCGARGRDAYDCRWRRWRHALPAGGRTG